MQARAMSGLSGVKQCDAMIKAASSGQAVDLNDLPELPSRETGIQEAAMQVKTVIKEMDMKSYFIVISLNTHKI